VDISISVSTLPSCQQDGQSGDRSTGVYSSLPQDWNAFIAPSAMVDEVAITTLSINVLLLRLISSQAISQHFFTWSMIFA
jgi:hypothetical protein